MCARVAGAQLRLGLFQAGSVGPEKSVRGRAPRRMWPRWSRDLRSGLEDVSVGGRRDSHHVEGLVEGEKDAYSVDKGRSNM
jgi:hypothetical protein